MVFLCPILKILPTLNCIKIQGMEADNVDDYFLKQKELEAAAKAAGLLEQYLFGAIATSGIETVKGTGDLMSKSKVMAVPSKDTGQLSHIAIKAPRYSYMLNYGFEGIKSNRVAMQYNAYNHIGTALNAGNVVENLATEIGGLRGEQVISKINFK